MTLAWSLDIPHTEKIVLLALSDNASDEGKCYPSVATLTRKCGLSERSVQSMITRLANGGHLTCYERAGRSTVYTVHPVVTPAGGAPRTDCTPHGLRGPPAQIAPPPPQVVHPTPAGGAPITVIEPSFESSPNRQARSARPRKRCPEEFQVTEDLRTWATEHAASVDIDAETAAFRDYEFRNGKTDWVAVWRNWMRTASERKPRRTGTGYVGNSLPPEMRNDPS